MLRGIDISNWQCNLHISNVASQIDFVICKATEGIYFVDRYCDSFIEDAKSSNLLWGFYHFAGNELPELEAEFFYNNCRNYFGHGIPVLDYETENGNNVDWCERFLTHLHELSGVWAMIYMSAYRVPEYNGSWIPQNCGLWIAGYPYDASCFNDDDMPYSIGAWEFCAIWQFTSSLQLFGYARNLDGDYAYMDADAWMKYAGCDSDDAQPAQPALLSYIDVAKEVMNGLWGNGDERRTRLQDAGYVPDTVQTIINDYYELAKDIIKGKWGNGWNRKNALEGAGYDYELAQMIANILLLRAL